MFIDINQLAEQGIHVNVDEVRGRIDFRVEGRLSDTEHNALCLLAKVGGNQRAEDDLAEAILELRNMAIVRASIQGFHS